MKQLLVVLMLAVMCGAQEKPKVSVAYPVDTEITGFMLDSNPVLLGDHVALRLNPQFKFFRGDNSVLISFDVNTGKVTYGEGFTTDEFSRLFWSNLFRDNPVPLRKRISELEKENKELKRKLSNDKGYVNVITGETPGITLK